MNVGDKVALRVDEDWRQTNTRIYSAGHLIADLVHEAEPLAIAVSGHHWPGEGRADFDLSGDVDVDATRNSLESQVTQAVEADIAFVVCGDPYTSRTIKKVTMNRFLGAALMAPTRHRLVL